MRILIVSQYFYPENFRINQLAVALREQGHELVVLTGEPNYPSGTFFEGYGFWSPKREIYQGMEVIRVPLLPRGRGGGLRLIANYLSFVFFAIFFGLPRLSGRFDVCLSWCSSPITGAIPAIVYRWLHRTPVAIWVQDLWPETFFAVTKNRNPLAKTVLRALVKWIYRHVDQIWMQSPAYETSLREHGALTKQIQFVPNWAEDFYDGSKVVESGSGVLPANSLVFAGNLGRAQGLEILIAAAAAAKTIVPKAHWVFIGEGTLREWLQAEVARLGLEKQVTFLARRPATEIPQLFKSAAAVLVALGNESVYAQTIPSKVQSCLASGRPIIGVLFGEPARIIVESRSGLVVPPDDPIKLAETVNQFFALSEEERNQMGHNGNVYYKEHFTQSKVVSQIERLLSDMGQAESK